MDTDKAYGEARPDLLVRDAQGRARFVAEVIVTHEPEPQALRVFEHAGLAVIKVWPAWDVLEDMRSGLTERVRFEVIGAPCQLQRHEQMRVLRRAEAAHTKLWRRSRPRTRSLLAPSACRRPEHAGTLPGQRPISPGPVERSSPRSASGHRAPTPSCSPSPGVRTGFSSERPILDARRAPRLASRKPEGGGVRREPPPRPWRPMAPTDGRSPWE